MRDLSKEMTKVGIIEEIIEETMDSIEPEELEEQAQVCIFFNFLNILLLKKQNI